MKKSAIPKVTFGIIVLNGEPFTRFCLRSLYPFAHEIIVVEGGHVGASAVCTPDGHSIDGTLESLLRFKCEEDIEGKVQIVTRDGFWPNDDEMRSSRTAQSKAYAERATGDFLWQVDIDEFYMPSDMQTLMSMLAADTGISGMSFKTLTFWGRPEYRVDGWYLRRGGEMFDRLFRWGPGFRYVKHESPTVVDNSGRDLREDKWISGKRLARQGVFMYHYAFLFPWQVRQKCLVYQGESSRNVPNIVHWADEIYFGLRNPYRVHNVCGHPSWLQRFNGRHPPQVIAMIAAVSSVEAHVEIRPKEDIERLVSSISYQASIAILKAINPYARLASRIANRLMRACGRLRSFILNDVFGIANARQRNE